MTNVIMLSLLNLNFYDFCDLVRVFQPKILQFGSEWYTVWCSVEFVTLLWLNQNRLKILNFISYKKCFTLYKYTSVKGQCIFKICYTSLPLLLTHPVTRILRRTPFLTANATFNLPCRSGASQAVESRRSGRHERQAAPRRHPPPARHPRVGSRSEAGALVSGQGCRGPGVQLASQALQPPGRRARRSQTLGHRHPQALAPKLFVGKFGAGGWFFSSSFLAVILML